MFKLPYLTLIIHQDANGVIEEFIMMTGWESKDKDFLLTPITTHNIASKYDIGTYDVWRKKNKRFFEPEPEPEDLDSRYAVQDLLLMDTINLRKSSRGLTYYKEIARFNNLGTCSNVVQNQNNRWYAGYNDGFI